MPKQKSKRAARKRFMVTKSGNVKHSKQNRRHILTKKSTKRKRNLRKGGVLANKQQTATIRTLVQE